MLFCGGNHETAKRVLNQTAVPSKILRPSSPRERFHSQTLPPMLRRPDRQAHHLFPIRRNVEESCGICWATFRGGTAQDWRDC